jgi:hypothetical protein
MFFQVFDKGFMEAMPAKAASSTSQEHAHSVDDQRRHRPDCQPV